MEILKKIWKMCGEEKGSCQILLVLCTILTVYTVIFHVQTPELGGMMIGLNVVMGIMVIFDDKD